MGESPKSAVGKSATARSSEVPATPRNATPQKPGRKKAAPGFTTGGEVLCQALCHNDLSTDSVASSRIRTWTESSLSSVESEEDVPELCIKTAKGLLSMTL